MHGCVVAFWALSTLAAAAVVEVTVKDAVTKEPIQGARIQLHQGDEAARSGVTDAQGVFRAGDLKDGQYRLSVEHEGHMRLAPDHPAALPFALSAAAAETVRLHAELVPRGQIAGRILNSAGEPMRGVPVGLRRLWDEQWIQTAISAEGGAFRIPNLEPGPWILAALPTMKITLADPARNPRPVAGPGVEDGQRAGWVATFYPGVIDFAGAARIILAPGAVLEGYDVKLRTAPLRKLSGVVMDDEGKPAPNASLSLIDVSNKGSNGAMIIAGADGRFEFDAAMDGDWRIFAQAGSPQRRLKGLLDLRVSRRDLAGIEVRLAAPFPVEGFVEREEPRDQEGNRKVTGVYLIPQGATPDFQESAFHDQDGRFVLKSVYPGRFRVLPVGYVPGYYVSAVWYGDQEITTSEIEIVNPPLPLRVLYKSGAASLTGIVERGGGAEVVLVPQDEALRDQHQFIRSAKSDSSGKFSIGSLRPGSYYAFAFDRLHRAMLEDVDFVRRLTPRAVRVTLRHGETASVELRAQPWPEF